MFDLEEYSPWWLHEEDPEVEEWKDLKYRYVPS